MDSQFDLAPERFAIGQPVRRSEDPVLLRGEGRFTDDLNLPGQTHLCFVRSPYPHARIVALDTSSAATMPGTASRPRRQSAKAPTPGSTM